MNKPSNRVACLKCSQLGYVSRDRSKGFMFLSEGEPTLEIDLIYEHENYERMIMILNIKVKTIVAHPPYLS